MKWFILCNVISFENIYNKSKITNNKSHCNTKEAKCSRNCRRGCPLFWWKPYRRNGGWTRHRQSSCSVYNSTRIRKPVWRQTRIRVQRHQMSPVKRICVFEHSVMTNFNCACPDIQRGQGAGFLSEGSSWLTACMSEQRRFWRDCADAQARLNLRCSHRR